MYENIDHIVYAVANLERSIEIFTKATGLKVYPGGEHPDWGTHNAIVRIGEQTYLEFIAKKKSSQPVHKQTWMGLDLIESDKITRWALASKDVELDAKYLKKYNEDLATIVIGSRAIDEHKMLNWLMTTVLPSPWVEPAPFLIDWKKSEHPTAAIPQNCSIKSFTIEHAESEVLKKLLEKLQCPIEVYTTHSTQLKLVLDTPKGEIVI